MLAYWLVSELHRAQRAVLWAEGVYAWTSVGLVEPRRAGWVVRSERGYARVQTGVRGTWTLVVKGEERSWTEGLLPADTLDQLI